MLIRKGNINTLKKSPAYRYQVRRILSTPCIPPIHSKSAKLKTYQLYRECYCYYFQHTPLSPLEHPKPSEKKPKNFSRARHIFIQNRLPYCCLHVGTSKDITLNAERIEKRKAIER